MTETRQNPTLTPDRARLLWHSFGTPTRLLIAAMGVHLGTRTFTDGVERIYAPGLLEHPEGPFATVAEDGATYTLTDAGWELFYAGTEWSRDHYSRTVQQGQPVQRDPDCDLCYPENHTDCTRKPYNGAAGHMFTGTATHRRCDRHQS